MMNMIILLSSNFGIWARANWDLSHPKYSTLTAHSSLAIISICSSNSSIFSLLPISMLSPCYIHAISLLYPCYLHAISMLSLCNLHAISLLPPCYLLGVSLLSYCYLLAISLLSPRKIVTVSHFRLVYEELKTCKG